MPRYQPHPILDRERAAMANFARRTGKTFAQWVALARKQGPKAQKELKAWLVARHGLTGMNAMWIATTAVSKIDTDYSDPEPLVDHLYSGPRAALRPLHEKIVDQVIALGDEVIVTACKTMVPCYRKFVFAEIAPVEGGVAVHLALGDAKATKRLAPSAGRAPGDRLTRQVIVRSPKDLDAEFRGWLAKAYEAGAAKAARAKGETEVPSDLAKAITASAAARKTWEACTAAMRRDLIEWIVSAKQAETRTRRVGQAIGRLAAGHKRMY